MKQRLYDSEINCWPAAFCRICSTVLAQFSLYLLILLNPTGRTVAKPPATPSEPVPQLDSTRAKTLSRLDANVQPDHMRRFSASSNCFPDSSSPTWAVSAADIEPL